MRILALAFLVCLSSLANAQFKYDYPLLCDSTSKMIESLGKNYQEKIRWTGAHVDDKSVYSLWINDRTGSWTLLKMNTEYACILGVGDESKLTLGESV
jgi:hypothetical protein